jgi:hypothetical protein
VHGRTEELAFDVPASTRVVLQIQGMSEAKATSCSSTWKQRSAHPNSTARDLDHESHLTHRSHGRSEELGFGVLGSVS